MPLITEETFFTGAPEILPPADKGKAACIGSGPASLACAAALRFKGYDVSVFEAMPKAGGTLTYAVPEYKLPQQAVDKQIALLESAGIKFFLSMPFCTQFNAKKLAKLGFQSVFLGTGLWGTKRLMLSGADLDGVFDASAFLALTKHGGLTISPADKVVVAGAGCSAVHSAVAARLKGARTTIVSRGGLEDFRADKKDTAYAQSLGISFLYNFEIRKISGKNGHADIVRMRSADGHSAADIEASKTVFAYGRIFSKPNAGCSLMLSDADLIQTRGFATGREGYFSGGDAVRGRSTIELSAADGRNAAEQMAGFMKNQKK